MLLVHAKDLNFHDHVCVHQAILSACAAAQSTSSEKYFHLQEIQSAFMKTVKYKKENPERCISVASANFLKELLKNFDNKNVRPRQRKKKLNIFICMRTCDKNM